MFQKSSREDTVYFTETQMILRHIEWQQLSKECKMPGFVLIHWKYPHFGWPLQRFVLFDRLTNFPGIWSGLYCWIFDDGDDSIAVAGEYSLLLLWIGLQLPHPLASWRRWASRLLGKIGLIIGCISSESRVQPNVSGQSLFDQIDANPKIFKHRSWMNRILRGLWSALARPKQHSSKPSQTTAYNLSRTFIFWKSITITIMSKRILKVSWFEERHPSKWQSLDFVSDDFWHHFCFYFSPQTSNVVLSPDLVGTRHVGEVSIAICCYH